MGKNKDAVSGTAPRPPSAAQNFEVVYYAKENGERPAEEFILSLDDKMAAKVNRRLDLLAEYGNMVREPFSKYLRDEIFELRVSVATNETRVLYFFTIGKKIVLTNGFVKKTQKTQKTPDSEIELAVKYRADYLSRQE